MGVRRSLRALDVRIRGAWRLTSRVAGSTALAAWSTILGVALWTALAFPLGAAGPPSGPDLERSDAPVETPEILDATEYLRRLEGLSVALRSQDWDTARQRAEALGACHVRLAGQPLAVQTLAVDRSLLVLVAKVPEDQPVHALLERLDVQRRELAASMVGGGGVEGGGVEAEGGDADLLAAIEAEQRAEALRSAGHLPEVAVPETIWRNRFTAWLGERLVWLGEKIEGLVDWLFDQWRSEVEDGVESSSARLDARLVTVLVVLLALLIAWMALRWLRGDRGVSQGVAASSESLLSQAPGDDNPLSREGGEWERYAEQLAAAGRLREAIRAWYHAVLVHLYRGGLLHYRKGRTNWEYVAALPARLDWRSRFIELTRHFETEWYGRGASSEDALERCRRAAGDILSQLRPATPSDDGPSASESGP